MKPNVLIKFASTLSVSLFTVIVNHFCKPLTNSALSLSAPAILLVQMYKVCCILWSIAVHVSHHKDKMELHLGFQDKLLFQNLYPLALHHLLSLEVFLTFSWPCRTRWAKWACEYSSLVLQVASAVALWSYGCAVLKPSLISVGLVGRMAWAGLTGKVFLIQKFFLVLIFNRCWKWANIFFIWVSFLVLNYAATEVTAEAHEKSFRPMIFWNLRYTLRSLKYT